MNHNSNLSDLERQQLMTHLIEFRSEWEIAADGMDLLEVQAPVGLILSDMVDLVGFSQSEKQSILGTPLFNAVTLIVELCP